MPARAATAYAALLRGVNVGGRTLPMAALRASLEGLGLDAVATYIQSGNAVFRTARSGAALGQEIERRLVADTGVETRVILRTAAELRRLARRNPFLDDEAHLSRLHVLFLERAPARSATASLDPGRSPADRFSVDGREVFLHYPDGLGRSKLSTAYLERTLGVAGTARNWNTVLELAARTAAL